MHDFKKFETNTSKKLETNRNLLRLINVFTPLIKTETEYNIYDVSLKRICMKRENNEDNKTIEVYADDDFINEYKKDDYIIKDDKDTTYRSSHHTFKYSFVIIIFL